MDYTKFMSLLIKNSLFFCRVDKLGDEHEMSLPLLNRIEHQKIYQKSKSEFKEGMREVVWNKMFDIIKSSALVNSWHRNEYESAAMWNIYMKTSEGIAIQSTFSRLRDCFHETTDEVKIGIIEYIDYNKDKIKNDCLTGYLSHKQKSYEHEQELRAIITNQNNKRMKPLYKIGKYVHVDLNLLVETVYIAPNSPDWFHDLVVDSTKAFGYNFNIIKSSLKDQSIH